MSEAPPPAAPRASLVGMIAGQLVWASCFVFLYATLSVGCHTGLHSVRLLGTTPLTLALTVVWIVHLATCAWLALQATRATRAIAGDRDRPRPFLLSSTRILHWAALVATAAIGAPVLLLPPCV